MKAKNWKDFLDQRFISPDQKIVSRDRVPVVCSECSYVSVMLVSNLKQQIKRSGTHRCWSCAVKHGLKKKP